MLCNNISLPFIDFSRISRTFIYATTSLIPHHISPCFEGWYLAIDRRVRASSFGYSWYILLMLLPFDTQAPRQLFKGPLNSFTIYCTISCSRAANRLNCGCWYSSSVWTTTNTVRHGMNSFRKWSHHDDLIWQPIIDDVASSEHTAASSAAPSAASTAAVR